MLLEKLVHMWGDSSTFFFNQLFPFFLKFLLQFYIGVNCLAWLHRNRPCRMSWLALFVCIAASSREPGSTLLETETASVSEQHNYAHGVNHDWGWQDETQGKRLMRIPYPTCIFGSRVNWAATFCCPSNSLLSYKSLLFKSSALSVTLYILITP